MSYKTAACLLDALASLDTEPHALLVMRHGLPVIEGYWAPYGPGVIHGAQSLTKTVTGIALGAALEEGILSLDDRLIDLFPEHRHWTDGRPYWDELCVRHIATMSAGMDTQPVVTSADWLESFFRTDIVHKPGTAFFYNSIACSMVGACIRKRSGLGLMAYLSKQVFPYIGIEPAHLVWHCHMDGLENGSGGLVSTARDNALLMELYRRGGVWEGRRILAEDWVRFALHEQNAPTGGDATYGGMMWIRPGCCSADGAMGQWGMLFPEKDVVVSVLQTITDPAADALIRHAIFDFVDALTPDEQPWSAEETRLFNRRLAMQAIPAPVYGEHSAALDALDGRTLRIISGEAHFFADDLEIFDRRYIAPVQALHFDKRDGDLLLTVTAMDKDVACPVALTGYRPVCRLSPVTNNPARTASVTGSFPDPQTLRLEIRWLESCRVHILTIRFGAEGAELTTHRVPVGGFDVPDVLAQAVWESRRK